MTPEAPQVARVHVVRGLLSFLRPYRHKALLALVVLVGAVAATLASPALIRYAINDGLVRHQSLTVITIAAAGYLVVAAATFVLSRVQTRLLSGVGEHVLNDLRNRVFSHLLAQPMEFFDSESSGQLLARMTADIDVLESLVQSGLGTFATSVALFFFSIVVLVLLSPLLFLSTLVCLVPVMIAAARYRVAATRAYALVRERIGDTLASLDEGLAGVRVVQAFRREATQSRLFSAQSRGQVDAEMAAVRLSSRFFPKVEASGVLANAVILGVGGLFAAKGIVSVGTVAAFVLYVTNLFDSIQSLSQLFDLLQSSGAALRTVFALLDVEPSMTEPARPKALPRRGRLELRQVGFTYHSTDSCLDADQGRSPVLSDVDLAVDEGEHLVLMGPTGAGKSTLAKLIGRLYDPSTGSVRLGGVDLRQAGSRHLRRAVVVVPQEGFLFRGSVLDNILLGRPGAGEDDALRALDALGIRGRLEALPEGLRTDVGERGSHLSAGERQLVSLARAALADPAVLVMDEATSSLDPGTEKAVEEALGVLSKGRTTITVAHRVSTAQRADRVAVVKGGRLVEHGPHDELVEAGGVYAGLHAAWLGRPAPTPSS